MASTRPTGGPCEPVAARCVMGMAICLLVFGRVVPLGAQIPSIHYPHRSDYPPGAIGQMQLARGGPLLGYYQPVQIQAPPGAAVSFAENDGFALADPARAMVGMLIGHVYRLRISQIPYHEGQEVFPTVELIDRLYPPPGWKTRFPIPIQLTQRELEWALEGKYVTRVIYLETPSTAPPVSQDPQEQRYMEVEPSADPLLVADQLGRPMAILRIGGRVPDRKGSNNAFLFHSPPLERYVPVESSGKRPVSGATNSHRPAGNPEL